MITALAVATGMLWLVRLFLFVALHVVASGYNPVEHAVSDYAVGRTSRLAATMTWVTAGAWAASSVLVAVGLPDWDGHLGTVACLAALAIMFAALPYLPTDLEGQRRTVVGVVHYLVAIGWFALAYACMSGLVAVGRADGPSALATGVAVTERVALVGLVALVVSLVVRPLRRLTFGVSERVFIVAVNLFYLGITLAIAVH